MALHLVSYDEMLPYISLKFTIHFFMMHFFPFFVDESLTLEHM